MEQRLRGLWLQPYIHQIWAHEENARKVGVELDAAPRVDPADVEQVAAMYDLVRRVLALSANVSKLLDPPDPRRVRGEPPSAYAKRKSFTRERGQALVAALRADNFASLKKRSGRNALEHFDERLDNFIASLGSIKMRFHVYGAVFNSDNEVDPNARYFQLYVRDTGLLTVADEVTDVSALRRELRQVGIRARHWVPTGDGDPRLEWLA